MTTLITVSTGDGVRRCDSRCYNASHPECDCVCGGANHGKGLKRARANTAAIARGVVERFKGKTVTFGPEELPLFPGKEGEPR